MSITKKLFLLSAVISLILLHNIIEARAGADDVAITLGDSSGGSAFQVQDSGNTPVFQVDSLGSMTAAVITVTGTVTASGFIGDGSQLGGIITTGSSETLTAVIINTSGAISTSNQLVVTGGNFRVDSAGSMTATTITTTGTLTVTGNIKTDDDVTNTFVGIDAGASNTTGNMNTANGFQALAANTAGTSNTAIGVDALLLNTTGNKNTAIGNFAGLNSLGSGNVFLGFAAGLNETGTNTLYIANSSTNTLIYGNFGSMTVGIGTTTPAIATGLHVVGTILADRLFTSSGSPLMSMNNGINQFDLRIPSGTNRFEIFDFTDSAVRLVIDTAGNVGIGTTTPAANQRLHVSGGNIQVGESASVKGITLFDTVDGSAHCVRITNDVLAVTAGACP